MNVPLESFKPEELRVPDNNFWEVQATKSLEEVRVHLDTQVTAIPRQSLLKDTGFLKQSSIAYLDRTTLLNKEVSGVEEVPMLRAYSPVVEKEWNASGGTIEIITDALYDVDGITINGYTHNIKFKNVNFSNPDNSFSFTEYIFGNYETDL